MRFKDIPYKRINVRLSRSLYKKLEINAINEFVTKSELVRKWMSDDRSLYLKGSFDDTNDVVCFNFRIDLKTLKKFEEKCKLRGISKSSYIRLLIVNNLSPINASKEVINETALSKSYNYYEIKRHLDSKGEAVSNSELVTLLDANTRLNLFDKALDVFSLYEHRKTKLLTNESMQLNAELSKMRIDLSIKYNPKLIVTLEDLNKRALTLKDRKALGEINLLKGEFFRCGSNFELSSTYYDKALEYLDIINYPNEVVETYIRIAAYNLYQSNHLLTKKFLDKASSILKSTRNKIHESHYFNVKSLSYCFNNVEESIDHALKGLNLNKEANLIRGQIYASENLTRFFIFKRDYNNAYKQIKSATSKLKFIQTDFDFMRLRLCRLFVESFTHYTESVRELSLLKFNNKKALGVVRCDYILSAVKYINGKSFYDRQSAEMNLKRISNEGVYPAIQKAAQYTLENKNLYLYF